MPRAFGEVFLPPAIQLTSNKLNVALKVAEINFLNEAASAFRGVQLLAT